MLRIKKPIPIANHFSSESERCRVYWRLSMIVWYPWFYCRRITSGWVRKLYPLCFRLYTLHPSGCRSNYCTLPEINERHPASHRRPTTSLYTIRCKCLSRKWTSRRLPNPSVIIKRLVVMSQSLSDIVHFRMSAWIASHTTFFTDSSVGNTVRFLIACWLSMPEMRVWFFFSRRSNGLRSSGILRFWPVH